MSPNNLQSLAESPRSTGLLQPIIVRWDSRRSLYVIIAGERRYRAAQLAGFDTVTCVVKQDVTPAEIAEMQLAENFARLEHESAERQLLTRAFTEALSSTAVAQAATKSTRSPSHPQRAKAKQTPRTTPRPLTFQTDHADIIVKPTPAATTYNHIAESLQQSLEEVNATSRGG